MLSIKGETLLSGLSKASDPYSRRNNLKSVTFFKAGNISTLMDVVTD